MTRDRIFPLIDRPTFVDWDEGSAPPKELYPVEYEAIKIVHYDEKEVEKIVKLFWWCSLNDGWGWFDFDDFFYYTKPVLRAWVEQHFEDYAHELNGDMSNWQEVLQTAKEDGKHLYAHSSTVYPIIEDLVYLYQRILAYQDDNWSRDEKIRLADELIHVEHTTGSILAIRNMDELRYEFERRYT